METNIKELQELVNKIFKDIITMCESNGITYFCQAGTVLGAVRHSGPIPWDYDADIIIPNNQIDYFVKCVKENLSDKYYIDYYKVNKKELRQFPRVGINGFDTKCLHLDVFRLIGLPNDRDKQLSMVKEANYYTEKNKLMRAKLVFLLYKGYFKEAVLKIFNKYYYINKFDELCNRYDYDKSNYVMNPSGKYKEKNIFKKDVYGKGIKKQYCDFEALIPDQYDFYLKQYYGNYMSYPPKEEIDKELSKHFIIKEK